MISLRVLALAFTAALLTACGGGGDSCTKTATVQLFGDSTMYGLDSFTHLQAVPSPAQLLQAELDARFGAGVVMVALNAVSSTDSTQLLNGADGLNPPWPQSVDADLVVINHGINDQDVYRGVSIDTYEANLRKLIALSPAKVLLETPNATPGPNPRFAEYVQRMRDVAASTNTPLADTNAYVKSVPSWESYFADFAHPNAAMYALIVKNSLAPAVVQQIGPMVTCD